MHDLMHGHINLQNILINCIRKCSTISNAAVSIQNFFETDSICLCCPRAETLKHLTSDKRP